jgi:hypothetical protein
MASKLQDLNHSIIFEIVKAMALPQTNVTQSLVRFLFGKATLRFSKLLLGLDHEIELNGLMAGAQWLLKYFVSAHHVRGVHLIPKEGPLIIASNHPASYDGMVITASVPRLDFKIIIGQIPPYEHVPHLSQHAIFSPPAQNTFGRMQTVRNVIKHLKNGGAILIFPRGGIEPDPAFMPDPDAEFNQWSRSLEIFLKHVPETQVLITAVSGVISEKIFHHPITWFRKSRADKQRLAFMYQIIRQAFTGKELFGLQPRVTFGELLSSLNHKNILAEVEQSARRTMKKHLSLIRTD